MTNRIGKKNASQQGRNIPLKDILEAVMNTQAVTEKELRRPSRIREIVYPRQVFCYLAYQHAPNSVKEIGLFVNRDHTTCLASYHQVQSAIDIDYEEITSILEEVKRYLNIPTRTKVKDNLVIPCDGAVLNRFWLNMYRQAY